MAPVRVGSLLLALMLGSASASLAQMVVGPAGSPQQSPGGFPAQGSGTFPGAFPGAMPGASPGLMPGAFPGQAPQQMPPCMAEFVPLRTETEKRAAAVKAAAGKHLPPQELCPLFTHFIEAEAKVVKFLEKNAGRCGIPAQAVSGSKTNHLRAAETKDKVCAAASGAATEARRGPGLGEALGVRGFSPDTTTTGAGTLDSLSGNPLKR